MACEMNADLGRNGFCPLSGCVPSLSIGGGFSNQGISRACSTDNFLGVLEGILHS